MSGMEAAAKPELKKDGKAMTNIISSSCLGFSVKMDEIETTNSQCTLEGGSKEDGTKKNVSENGSNNANTTSSCLAASGKSECYVKYELPSKKAEDDWPSIDSSDFWAVETDNQNSDVNNKVSVPSCSPGTTKSGKSECADELALPKQDNECAAKDTEQSSANNGVGIVREKERQIVIAGKSECVDELTLPKQDNDNVASESAAKDTEQSSANNGTGVICEKEQLESTDEKNRANLKRKRDESQDKSESDTDLTNKGGSTNAQESDASTSYMDPAEKLAKKIEKQKMKRRKQKEAKKLKKQALKQLKGSDTNTDETNKANTNTDQTKKANTNIDGANKTSNNTDEVTLTNREKLAIRKFKEITGCDIKAALAKKTYALYKIVKAIENLLYGQTPDQFTEENVVVFVPYLLEAMQRNFELLKKYDRERDILKYAQSAAHKTVLMRGFEMFLTEAVEQVKRDNTVVLAYRKTMKDFKMVLSKVLSKFNRSIDDFPPPARKATLLQKNGSAGTRITVIKKPPRFPSDPPSTSPAVRTASPWATDGTSYVPQRAAESPDKPTNRFGDSPASNNRPFEQSNNRPFEQSNNRSFEQSNNRSFEQSNTRSFERSPFVNSPSTSFRSTSPQRGNLTNQFQKVLPSPWAQPPSALATKDSVQGKNEDFLVSIIDKSSISGVIPPNKEKYVKNVLFEALDMAVSSAPFGSSKVPTFTSWEYKNGVIHVVCSDDYSLQWLVRKVVDIEPWPGATLGTRIDSDRRYRVTLELLANPGKYEEIQVIMERLAAQNRKLNIMSWTVVSHKCHGRPKTHYFVFDIPEEDLQELNRCGSIVNYGFQTFKVVQDMD